MFDIDFALQVLEKVRPTRVVLQFQDSFLSESVSVFQILREKYSKKEAEFYINADSTWGSSADDISSKHVDGDIILMFGKDATIRNSLVYFIPFSLKVPVDDAIADLRDTFEKSFRRVHIFYESTYFWLALKVFFAFGKSSLAVSQLVRNRNDFSCSTDDEVVGGFHVDRELDLDKENCGMLYIGSTNSQLTYISGRFPDHHFFHYDPSKRSSNELPPRNRLLAERYGRISRVEASEIIGIIIHSMSMEANETKRIIDAVEEMIKMAGKQFYTFAIGRIDESKLENFPEIDLFCLISADSINVLGDRKWRRPIITPFELQVGLGLRDWESVIRADLDIIYEGAAAVALNQAEDSEDFALTKAEQRAVAVINGKGSEYFSERSYKGLIPKEDNLAMDIVKGHFGTASSYTRATDS